MKIENDLLLRTANGEQVERPPVWLMRQAGRILPQYRALRGRLSGFKELVETPQLAAEVTIQPVDELGVDAAIIFSDILVIPEAMGLTYEMVEKKGPWFPKTIESLSDVEKLGVGENVLGELQYVFDALEVTKKELNGRVPLIGFAGAPWTIFSYMLEGSGSKTFSKARKFLYQNPKAAHLLLDKITQTTIAYLRQKVHSGANMIQIFDSWAGILPPHQYSEFAIPYIKKIVDAIEGVPVIVFAKGAWFAMEEISKLDCQVLGVDWNTKVGDLRDKLNVQQVLQGNLDPCMLYSSQENIQTATLKMLKEFGVGHIANLGHGVYPDTPLDNVKVFVNTVKGFSY
ncbi:uroporphyrinogen decarboxylase [Saprospiraceae bacterium]|nr:uroporphyrinogen decarboxylase [bacterium]MDC3219826.1 uroporphyrinogen decarboxylase [Saprospiraceae bacterium]